MTARIHRRLTSHKDSSISLFDCDLSDPVVVYLINESYDKKHSDPNSDNEMPAIPMICIIDDDESVRESVSDLVQSLGYRVASFASAEEYLQSDYVGKSSCVITDLRMPGMSGADLQARLLAAGQKTPIIFITSFPSEDIRMQVLKAGAFGFFNKPFNDDSLVECLNKAVGL